LKRKYAAKKGDGGSQHFVCLNACAGRRPHDNDFLVIAELTSSVSRLSRRDRLVLNLTRSWRE
jgi:hypothetical protein